MRRTLQFTAVLGLFAVGVGCKHVGGQCDCQNAPGDARLPAVGNAYPTVGAPVLGATAPAPASTAPAAVAPTPTPAASPERMPPPR